VIVKYGCEMMDRVEVGEADQLHQDRPQHDVAKRSRWLLLLRNPDNLSNDRKTSVQSGWLRTRCR